MCMHVRKNVRANVLATRWQHVGNAWLRDGFGFAFFSIEIIKIVRSDGIAD